MKAYKGYQIAQQLKRAEADHANIVRVLYNSPRVARWNCIDDSPSLAFICRAPHIPRCSIMVEDNRRVIKVYQLARSSLPVELQLSQIHALASLSQHERVRDCRCTSDISDQLP